MNCQTSNLWQLQGDSLVPAKAVPITDRGFRYGMSVFETIMVLRGRAILLSEHLWMLQSACQKTGFPEFRDLSEASQALLDSRQSFTGVLRIYVTAGDGAPADPISDSRVFMLLEEREKPSVDHYKITVSDSHHGPPYAGLKTANYWSNIQSLTVAKENGFQEAVLINHENQVISVCMGNLFLIKDGRLATPSLETGARNGVVRQWVLSRLDCEEVVLSPDALDQYTSAFITNSWLGVMPISQINQHEMATSFLTKQLYSEFQQFILDGS